MNSFQFIRLIWMIYGKGQIDLVKIQKMGLLAVKIGQVHALRLDFLPLEKCQKLAELYRKTIPISSESVLEQIDKSPFKKIEKKALASASVGQVHRAELKDGTQVVIKVIKNNFKEKFTKDVKSVKRLFKWILFFYPKLRKVFDPIGVLEHIEEYTLQELNLLNEIQGHETLKNIYEKYKKSYDLSRLAFPKIYKELSTENVMVSEFIPGKTFDEILDNKLEYKVLLELFNIHGFYLFQVGTFHGDIHAGNLMYYKNKIYFVDTGAIGHASKKLRIGLFNFLKNLSTANYDEAAKDLNKMANKRLDKTQFKAFYAEFRTLYADFFKKTVSEVSLTRKMMETIKLAVNSGMEFEKGMFSIIKSMMFLDGMVIRNNPNAILLKDMKKYMENLSDYQKKYGN